MPLTGCVINIGRGDTKDDYQIDLNDFEDIVGMKGVKYLQIDNITEQNSISVGQMLVHATACCSPTVYHDKSTMTTSVTPQEYQERYVYIDSDRYMEKSRNTIEGDFSEPTEATEEDFSTPQKIVSDLLEYYHVIKDYGGSLTYNNMKSCYDASITYGVSDYAVSISVAYYFYKNQLQKCNIYSTQSYQGTIYVSSEGSQTFTYNKITPVVPE